MDDGEDIGWQAKNRRFAPIMSADFLLSARLAEVREKFFAGNFPTNELRAAEVWGD